MERRYTAWYVSQKCGPRLIDHRSYLGGAHRVSVDDEYKGYRIPAGSIIIANCWWACTVIYDQYSI
jgi:hypothetical protein